jgi:hypothetical protein
MLQRAAARAVVVAVAIAGVLGPLHLLGIGLWLLFGLGVALAFLALLLPPVGVRVIDGIVQWVRGRHWGPEEGRFHSFNGVPLRIEDDGRHVWVAGDGVLRVLGRREPDEALAARHAGRWQRTPDGVLMLRVDAVVEHLHTMPGRDEPRVQRFRRYFEREVLFPAGRRRTRGGGG